jgi:hypothetical protein
LNECLSNININVDPYILIEIVLLKYVNVGNNFIGSSVASGFNEICLGDSSKSMENDSSNYVVNNAGNIKNPDISAKKDVSKSLDNKSNKVKVINKKKQNNIDLNIRINNCFVECTKDIKISVSKTWVEFMNFLITRDRSLISLLADTSILAASSSYILIQSKIDSTNELINNDIFSLEKFYEDFSGNKVKFAALSDNLWKKEMENYRINIKNGIKYSYMSEPEIENSVSDNVITSLNGDDIEEIAKDVFGSFEVE